MGKLKVEWTGSYPSLCCGNWVIKYNEVELYVPEEFVESDMGTYVEYSTWYFDEDMSEQSGYHADGLGCDAWILLNREWVEKMFKEQKIETTDELLKELFYEIQSEDFRSGSCGGCI